MATFIERILGVTDIYEYGTNAVDEYLTNIDGFARSYLFRVYCEFPKIVTSNSTPNNLTFYVKSTTLPDTNLEEVNTFFMGQQYKMSSVRRFTDWTVTIYIDNKGSVLNDLYLWSRYCHNRENIYALPKNYMSDVFIYIMNPLNPDNSTLTYKLKKAWPKQIANTSLDYQNNEFLTTDITFSYQWHEVTQDPFVVYSGEGNIYNTDIKTIMRSGEEIGAVLPTQLGTKYWNK